jgi:hypothetical protein
MAVAVTGQDGPMAQLIATAVAMVNASAEQVHEALLDYQEIRPQLLTEEFDEYQVRSGGHGAGTEVHWTMALDEAIRNKKGRKPKKQKRPRWDCEIQVDQPADHQILERDTRSTLVTVWTLQPADAERTAVRVDASWQAEGGLTQFMARQHDQLAVRLIYEGMLTKLHALFEPDPKAASEEPDETESSETESSETEGEPSKAGADKAEPNKGESGTARSGDSDGASGAAG